MKINENFMKTSTLYDTIQALGAEAIQWFAKLLIIIGAIISCLAMFGYFGALCHTRILLYIYSIALSLTIIFEFVGIIAMLSFHNNLWEFYDAGFTKIFQGAYRNNQTKTIEIMSKLEREFHCCGVNSIGDYIKSDYRIPLSCYPNQVPQEKPFNQGCAEAIVIWIWNELPLITGIFGTILLIEIFVVVASLVLGVAIAHSANTEIYYKL
ncbi:unnamed protein product [Adineta ricciae]|uniref:Tetraspanin n=1 Tax=Adineta ricciae TaxID=249248 RepID=A0A816CVE5_ADIRI|nr:unnamed protein product [Adineta ricciae]CAF1628655.1 unnamed protein product [Adineta ricciae]